MQPKEELDIDFSFLKEPTVLYVTFVRFIAAVLILYEPLLGVIASICLDWLDSQILLRITKISEKQYQFWDKNIDWLAYATEMTIAAEYGLFMPFMVLLFFRFVGHFMFVRTDTTIYYFLFPNFFEAAFLWLIIFFPNGVQEKVNLFNLNHPWGYLILFIFIKISQEISLHIIWPKIKYKYKKWESNTFDKFNQLISFNKYSPKK